MLSLTDRTSICAAARDPTLDPAVRAVLARRFEQLGGVGAHFHVAAAGDALADAERAVGFPLALDGEPAWEWVERHPGGVAEVTLILSDDGPAQVLLVPEADCPEIVDLLREHACG